MPVTSIIEEELNKYRNTLALLDKGEVDEDTEFKPYRLVHGIYGQRQGGTNQMVRIKLRIGRMSPEQMRVLADTSERYGTGISHITTRQAIQYHFVPLENTPALMEELEEAGMTTREACGNAVRGVVCSPLAGTRDDEPFDVEPYAWQIFEHFLRGPRSSTLPRKFKIGFAASEKDPQAFNNIQDIGVLAVEKDGKQGFRIRVAGALGSSPQKPLELYDCLDKEELVPVCEAVLRIHHKYGDRENRAKARLKFVLRQHGDEGFRKLFEEQLAEVRAENITGAALEDAHGAAASTELPTGDAQWYSTNLLPHREVGKCVAVINIPRGDVPAKEMRLLASLAEDYSNGDVAVSVDQNIYFRNVDVEKVDGLYAELKKLGFAASANQITDVLSCPGASTCQLGITFSKNMATELGDKLQEALEAVGVDKRIWESRINISGCPNSCGQHHIGHIGLHGAASTIGDKLIPHYVLMVGGGDFGDEVHHAAMVARIPAKRVVATIAELAKGFMAEANEGEAFAQYLRRIAGADITDKKEAREVRKALKARLEPIFAIAPEDVDESLLYDIGSDKIFSLDELGAGECMS